MTKSVALFFKKLELPTNTVLVFPVADGLALPDKLEQINQACNDVVRKAISTCQFEAKFGTFCDITGGVGDYGRVVLMGVGKEKHTNKEHKIDVLGAKLWGYLEHIKAEDASVVLEDGFGGFAPHFVASHMAYGAKLKSYKFDKYFTKKLDEKKRKLQILQYLLKDFKEAGAAFDKLSEVAEGVFLARDVVTEPPNVLYPESYAEQVKEAFKGLPVKIEVMGEKQLSKLGMGALLGVGQGSERESQVVVMHYEGASNKKDKPVAFVGKGVTFDTGGISIKPSNGMEDMKYDMGGSAVVVGVMRALAGRGANVNAVGVIGLVENMPDGNAQRPADVVTSMSGQTIEVLNTDAEGRLVLADILWYTKEKYQPKFMINLATLTGAIVVALADQYAGLFSNNDELSERLFNAGEASKEKVWRFPLTKEYDKMIDSKIADMQNIGNGRGAGSITAAQFLQRFVGEVPWAHIDIAGMAWIKKARPLCPEGAVGFGVRLLDRLVADYYEG